MIPRLHKRGTSFKGVCRYILHDANKDTSDRVLWVETQNLFSHPEDAWFEMFTVARDQALLKQQSGHDARGRKNTRPVLHYTLSWKASDNPTPEHMRKSALASLKALELEGHQVLMACHTDKEHLHVHLVVNTIHPDNGMTATLYRPKDRLSEWALAYELEHGIHCEQRVKNHEERERIRREKDAPALLRESLNENQQPAPYVAVKHKAAQREDWLDRKDIIARMRELRKEIAPLLPNPGGVDLGDLWKRQLQEREFHDRNTEAAVDHARTAVFERYRPQWRDLYRVHKKEMKHLQKNATHPFERAVYVYSQRERLGNGKPLTLRQMFQLILKPEQLVKRVEAVQQKERRSLASAEKSDKRVITKRLWEQHKAKFDAMRARQQQERVAARSEHETQLRSIVTFDLAKESLLAERRAAKTIEPQAEPTQTVAETFNTSVTTRTPTQMARVEAIKKQMEEWRKRNPGRDFGHEM